MPPKITPEVQRAMVEAPSGLTAGSVESRVAASLGEANADAALMIASGRDFNKDIAIATVDDSFGTHKPDGTIDRPGGSTAETRFNRTKDRINVLDKYLVENPGATPNAALIKEVSGMLQTHPALRDYFVTLGGSSGTTADAMAQRYLQDPQVRAKIKDLLLNRTGSDKILTDVVATAEAERQRLDAEKKRLEAEKTRLEGEVTTAQDRTAEFQPTVTPKGGGATRDGTVFREIQDLKGEINTQKIKVKSFEVDAESLRLQKRTLDIHLRKAIEAEATGATPPKLSADIQLEIDGINTKISANETDRVDAQNQVSEREAKIQSLNEERTRLTEEINNKTRRLGEIDNQLVTTDQNLTQKTGEVTRLKKEKERLETELEGQIMGIATDGAKDVLETRMQEAINKTRTLMEEDAAHQKQQHLRQFEEGLTRRWLTPDNKVNKTTIGEDFATLRGPAYNVTIDGQAFYLNGAQRLLARRLTSSGYTPAQVKDLLNDKAFIDEWSPKIAEKALTFKLYSGKISRGDILAIQQSTWGEGMVDRALQGRQDIQSAIDQAIGAGVVDWQGQFAEQFRKLPYKKTAAILAILAAMMVLGAAK